MILRPLVPETSTESICSWFARYLAAPERTQTYLIRQLSFPNLSQVFRSQPSKRQSTSSARVAPFTLSGRISPLANPEAFARVPKGRYRVLNWVSGHPGKHSWQSNTLLARANARLRRVGREPIRLTCPVIRLYSKWFRSNPKATFTHFREVVWEQGRPSTSP